MAAATTKKPTLSTGTLNLKFMQPRASGSTPVPALEKKKVVDEGEWDIGLEARKAWGINSQTDNETSTQTSVSYESSYMPFLSSTSANGHLKFGKGKARVIKEASAPDNDSHEADQSSLLAPPEAKQPSKAFPRSISRQQPPKRTRAPEETAPKTIALRPEGFLRPAGVDAPSSISAQRKRKSPVNDEHGLTFQLKDTGPNQDKVVAISTPSSIQAGPPGDSTEPSQKKKKKKTKRNAVLAQSS